MIMAMAGTLNTRGVARADWPQFRGPHGDGRAEARDLPHSWSVLRNLDWQVSLPGSGWSSPVFVGERIWLTAAEPQVYRDEQKEEREAALADKPSDYQAHAAVTLLAIEVDVTSGRLLRRIELGVVPRPPPIHPWNSYASATPVTDGERLVCHFASLGTYAIDVRSGRTLWQRRIEVDDSLGGGGSPILAGPAVIVACDGESSQSILALHKETGETLWQTPRPPLDVVADRQRVACSTPLLVQHGEQEQVIVPGAQWIVAYDPRTGREWWRVNHGVGYHVVPRPVYAAGRVYCCTGYPKPQLWAIRVTGNGDVTTTHVDWIYDRQVPEVASPALVGDEIYLVSVVGVVNCLDRRSGQHLWQTRLNSTVVASPLVADGKLYVCCRDGVTVTLQQGRELHELGRSQMGGLQAASPAVWQNSLIFRSSEGLYRVRSGER